MLVSQTRKDVRQDVLGKLHRRAEDLKPMMEEIQLKATGVAKSGGQRGPGTVKSDKKLTEFEPFNLTAVKPRTLLSEVPNCNKNYCRVALV